MTVVYWVLAYCAAGVLIAGIGGRTAKDRPENGGLGVVALTWPLFVSLIVLVAVLLIVVNILGTLAAALLPEKQHP